VSNLLRRGIPSVVADQSADAEGRFQLAKGSPAGTGAMLDSVPMDVSDFRDVMGQFF